MGQTAQTPHPTQKKREPEGSPLAIAKELKGSELKLQGKLDVSATRSEGRNGRRRGDIGAGAVDIEVRVVEEVVHLTAQLNL